VPRYFKQMEELNLNGPPLLSDLEFPKPYRLLDFEREMQEQSMIVLTPDYPVLLPVRTFPTRLICG